MKKQLIIISSTHAREINPLGKKPVQYNYEPGFIEPLGETSAYIGWKVIEDSLKEYRITQETGYGVRLQPSEIGSVQDFLCNDSNLTCVVL